MNVDSALPNTNNPRKVQSHYKEKASRAPHVPDISIMHGAVYRVEVRRSLLLAD